MKIRKEIPSSVGLFKICETDEKDFMIKFQATGQIGFYSGKKHFKSISETETYISALLINGFSRADL